MSSVRTTAPISRFSSTVSEGKTLSTWGTYDSPRRTSRLGARPVMSSPLSRIEPRRGRSRPNTVFMSVDLPAPLGPISVTISPGSDLDRHVVQDLHLLVAGADALDAEQAHGACAWRAPRYAASTRGSRRTVVGRPFRERPPLAHDDHRVADRHHQVHVVLDEQDGDAALGCQALDVARQLLHLRRVHPGARLVEHEQRGIGHQHAPELEQLLLAAGQRPRRLVGEPGQAHVLQHEPGLAHAAAPPRAGCARAGARASTAARRPGRAAPRAGSRAR